MNKLPSPESMSEEMVRQKAHNLFFDYVNRVGEEHIFQIGMNFEEIYNDFIYPEYEIDFDDKHELGVDDDGVEILGEYLPHENVALIDRNLVLNNDPRRVFTSIHEVIGHGVLQGDFLRKKKKNYTKLHSTADSILFEGAFEHQANTMAINFIAPEGYVLALYWKLFGTRRIINYTGPGKYSLCFKNMYWPVWVSSPYELAWYITKKLEHYFWGLSTESLMYRVLRTVINCNGYDNKDFSSSRDIDSIAEILQ